MTAVSLSYSRRRLWRGGMLGLALGLGTLWLASRLKGDEGFRQLHEAAIFYLLGPYGPRAVLFASGLAFAVMSAFVLRRVAGDRTAVAIRVDGIAVAGMFGARLIRWRALDGIQLRDMRLHGKTVRTLTVRSRRAPGERRIRHFFTGATHFSASQLEATPADIAAWVAAARAAQAKALLLPRSTLPQAGAAPIGQG